MVSFHTVTRYWKYNYSAMWRRGTMRLVEQGSLLLHQGNVQFIHSCCQSDQLMDRELSQTQEEILIVDCTWIPQSRSHRSRYESFTLSSNTTIWMAILQSGSKAISLLLVLTFKCLMVWHEYSFMLVLRALNPTSV